MVSYINFNMDTVLNLAKESNYLDDPNFVYNSCNNYIVILERLFDTKTNESRTNILKDGCRPFAKYRGNKFLVKDIIHKFDGSKVDSVNSLDYDDATIFYKIGEIVYPNNFDEN